MAVGTRCGTHGVLDRGDLEKFRICYPKILEHPGPANTVLFNIDVGECAPSNGRRWSIPIFARMLFSHSHTPELLISAHRERRTDPLGEARAMTRPALVPIISGVATFGEGSGQAFVDSVTLPSCRTGCESQLQSSPPEDHRCFQAR